MDRVIQYGQEQVRAFDQNWLIKDVLESMSATILSLLGHSYAVIAGLTGLPTSPASLSFTVSGGYIYQLAATDSSPFGSLPADAQQIMQQGQTAGDSFTLTTAGLTSGKSQWVLLACAFAQNDAIRDSDPTGGLLYYYNTSNPTQPFQGPGNDGTTQPTVRQGVIEFRVVYGTPATTGSEQAPSVPTGFTPLILIDLAHAQTTITLGQIIYSGPSVGAGVPSNYPYIPRLAGLLNSHHSGTPGQAPQINPLTEIAWTPAIIRGLIPHASTVALLTPGASTYTIPDTGWYEIELWGAGGGTPGSITTNVGVCGAGSGGYRRLVKHYTQGTVVNYTIGAGGVAVAQGGTGGTGGSTTWDTDWVATGGIGSTEGAVGTGGGGSGVGDGIIMQGSPGGPSTQIVGGVGGVGGMAPRGAGGGSSGTGLSNPGGQPGGGAGGPGAGGNEPGAAGGAGAIFITETT